MAKSKKITPLPRAHEAVYAAFMIFLCLAFIELSLRIIKFNYSTTPESMEYVDWVKGIGDECFAPFVGKVVSTFHKDKDVFWFPDANGPLTNSFGFRGREFQKEKTPGVTRIICLGDSVTQNGFPAYPEALEGMLKATAAGKKYEVINAGVGSYSSFQGLKLLETKLLNLKPDIITVFFGWNDHWLAWSHTDSELAGYWKLAAERKFLEKFKIYEFLTKHIVKLKMKKRKFARFRVPLGDYEKNLVKFISVARENNTKILFITAPTSITPESRMIRNLVQNTHLFPREDLINRVHSAYNSVVRESSLKNGIPLLDMELLIEKSAEPKKYFSDDIHFTPAGVEFTARKLMEKIVKEF